MSKLVKVVATFAAIAAAIPTGGTSLLALGLGVSATAAGLIAAGLSVGASLLTKGPKSPRASPEMVNRMRAQIETGGQAT